MKKDHESWQVWSRPEAKTPVNGGPGGAAGAAQGHLGLGARPVWSCAECGQVTAQQSRAAAEEPSLSSI